MLGVLFYRSFVDYWRALAPSLVVSATHFGLAAGAFFLVPLVENRFLVLLLAAGFILSNLVNYWFLNREKKEETPPLVRSLPALITHGFLMALFLLLQDIAIRFYFNLGNSWGLVPGVITIWVSIFLFGVLMILPAVIRGGVSSTIRGIRRGAKIIISDFLRAFLLILITPILLVTNVILLPGSGFIAHLWNNYRRFHDLRDEAIQDKAPSDWKAVLEEERKELEGTSLKSLIFPWKE